MKVDPETPAKPEQEIQPERLIELAEIVSWHYCLMSF